MSEGLIKLNSLDNILIGIRDAIYINDDLFKCLKYDESDALYKTITDVDKELLLDESNIDNCRIYFSPFNDKILKEPRTELRIYHAKFNPNNIYLTDVIIGFDIVVHKNLWRLEDSKRRPTTIFQLLLNSLNGLQLNSIGALSFAQNPCSLIYYNDNFTGYSFYMKTRSA